MRVSAQQNEGHVRLHTLPEGDLADERSTILEKKKHSMRHLSGQRVPSPSASVPYMAMLPKGLQYPHILSSLRSNRNPIVRPGGATPLKFRLPAFLILLSSLVSSFLTADDQQASRHSYRSNSIGCILLDTSFLFRSGAHHSKSSLERKKNALEIE